jgi:A/G-specific adenine glycosylase
VDGNVFRFLSRLFAVDEPVDTSRGKKYFTELAGELMDRSQAGAFNQAIMEFGALQCIPASPDCERCIFGDKCLAYAERAVARYPVKQNKTLTQDRYLYYFHIHDAEYLFIKQRVGKGIWQNLFEFPVIESERPLELEERVRQASSAWFPGIAEGTLPALRLRIENRKHVLSHRILYATFYELIFSRLPAVTEDLVRISRKEMKDYPLHRLMQQYWEEETGEK